MTRAKNCSLSSALHLDVTCCSSLTQLAMVLAADNNKLLENGDGAELDRKVGPT